ncbi:nephronectin isoform X1 [Chanodichthys erythropterus]|uniref:nephronectin isoform X1 n=1 Tax=Chanodichthys erythropterus TaxID=933992 RepID=UPI00351F35B6
MDVMLIFSLIGICAAAGSDTLRSSRPLVLSDGLCQYGRTQDCCLGWMRNLQGRCRPVCESGCKHGECVGPDQCRCHPGFTGKTCNQDVNECAFRPCKYRCMNTLGSYKCYCLNGFMMTADGSCRNARTCAMANCQYGCAVMKGEVKCQCPSPGLRLAPDGRTCVDIDECVTGQAKCARFRKCVNTFGSFVCRCHEGFELKHIDGKYHCTDKKFPSVCYDKPGHKKCRCKPSVNGKGYDCKLCFLAVVKVTIEPARPVKVTASPTTISTATTPMTTTEEITTTTTTTIAIPTTTVTTATSVPTSSAVTKVTPTVTFTVAMTTTKSTTTTALTTTATTSTTTETLPTTSPITTTTAATVANTTLETISTTTLDNRVHRESTAKPRGDVHIPRYENNLFDWDFDIELGNTAEHVRDDPVAGVVSCSFDEGLCVWMTDSEGDLKWEVKDDPAGGRYLSVPEATNKRSVRGARLTVALATPTKAWQGGDLCLAFRHRLHGHHIGSLQVFVRKGRSHSPSIWTRTGGHGWRHTQITLGGRGLIDIVLKAERRRGKHGEIAVDDLSLRRGACSDRDNRTE